MRICILKETFAIGGNERSASNVSKLLSKDHDVFLALFDADNMQYTYGGELCNLAIPSRKTIVGKIYNSFLRALALNKLVRQKKVDVVYMFTRIGNYQTQTKLKNAVKIISARDCASMVNKHKSYHSALKNSDALICNSEYIKNYYLSLYPKDRDKVFTVYNAINGEDIIRQSTLDVEPEFLEFIGKHRKNISAVGRFCKEKGFEYLIQAFAKARDAADEIGLVLIGDGAYKERYESIVDELGLKDCVYFTGFQSNPYKYMAKSDVFVLSSLSEGFPNVLAEAMALGLPVIATNCYSGPAEILREDCDYEAVTDRFVECDYGIITPRMTENENNHAIAVLAEAMVHLVCNDQLIEKYSRLSRQRAGEYSPAVAAEKFRIIFESLAKKRISMPNEWD